MIFLSIYPFKTQCRIILGHTVLLPNSVHIEHIYLPHAQTAIYDSKVKLFLKQGISRQLGRGRTQLFDLNARIQQLMSSLCKTRTGTKLTSFQNKNLPITNYVQTQTSVMFSNISMIIMYYEYMTTHMIFLSIYPFREFSN
jgi:hypothetical protein